MKENRMNSHEIGEWVKVINLVIFLIKFVKADWRIELKIEGRLVFECRWKLGKGISRPIGRSEVSSEFDQAEKAIN